MPFEPRIRVRWNPRAARRWCPGATPAPAEDAPDPAALGWTAFFRLQGVVGRFRRGAPGADPGAALPSERRPETESARVAESPPAE